MVQLRAQMAEVFQKLGIRVAIINSNSDHRGLLLVSLRKGLARVLICTPDIALKSPAVLELLQQSSYRSNLEYVAGDGIHCATDAMKEKIGGYRLLYSQL